MKEFMFGGYTDSKGNVYINKDIPIDHEQNNLIFLECSQDSGIIGFDCDEPSSKEAESLRSKIVWDKDLISYSSQYTIEDVKNGLAKFKVFFKFNSLGAKKNKNNKNVEVVYDTGGRSKPESKTLAIFGNRIKDEYQYLVHNMDKGLRELSFEPQEVLSHKTQLKLLISNEEKKISERSGSLYANINVEDGEDVDVEEFEKLLVAIGVELPMIELANEKLLTFKCLFPNAHTNMSGANAYAFKKDGVYVAKCHGNVCSGDYSWLNQKLKEISIINADLDFNYTGYNINGNNHTVYQAPTGAGKTEMLAQEINMAIMNKKPLLVILQNKESIQRLLQRVDFYSNNNLLATYLDSEEISVYTSESKDSLNIHATVIITHHYYFTNCGDILTYYPFSKEVLEARERTVIVDEAHTWLEMITRNTLQIGSIYDDNGRVKLINRKNIIRGNRNFPTMLKEDELIFKTKVCENFIDDFSNMKISLQKKVYNDVSYEDINSDLQKRYTLLGTEEEENYIYKYYKNPTVDEALENDHEDGVDYREKLFNSASYAVVALNVGDDLSRKNVGELTMMLQHYEILKMFVRLSKQFILLSATFSQYHKEVIEECFPNYEEIVIADKIQKVKDIVVLKSDKKSYKNRTALFNFLNDCSVPSLIFMSTIANCYKHINGLSNAMLNDNGRYVIGKRKDLNDYVDNYKRHITFAGLESTVAKGYNYLEEIEGDGFELLYFDSLPVSPPIIKKYVINDELVSYSFDYVKNSFAQAIGRAFRKNKDRLVIALNHMKGEEETIIEYLSEVTDANVIVDDLSLTNLKITLSSYIETDDYERNKEIFKNNPLFNQLYLTEDNEYDIVDLLLNNEYEGEDEE